MIKQYVLKQIVRVGIPTQEYEGTVTFHAQTEAELAELLTIYGAGQVDERIDDQLPPNHVYEGSYLRVEMVGLFSPSGIDVWPTMKQHVIRGAAQSVAV